MDQVLPDRHGKAASGQTLKTLVCSSREMDADVSEQRRCRLPDGEGGQIERETHAFAWDVLDGSARDLDPGASMALIDERCPAVQLVLQARKCST